MKMSKTFLITLFLLVLAIRTFPELAFADTSNEGSVEVHEVIRNGSGILIGLDYDLNSTSLLDTNESLAVLVIFSDSTKEDTHPVQAAMLFFHTDDNQFFLFWMLGDPFKQAQNWQKGTENEHFRIDGDQLTLIFIEFWDINNPEITMTVLAKISSCCQVEAYTNDFRIVLEQFIAELPILHEFPMTTTTSEETSGPSTTGETETSTSSEESSRTDIVSGFTILSIFGVLLSLFIIKSLTRKK